MQVEQIALYDDRPNVYLQTYIQDSQSLWQKQAPYPAIIICPGGSYHYLSEREGEAVALAFAAAGFQAFVLHYSVFQDQADTPELETHFPQPMKEIARAMEIVHQRADDWYIDRDKIGLIGFSAGGHNVGMYGNAYEEELISGECALDKENLAPAFNILAYPVTNFSTMLASFQPLSPKNEKAVQAFVQACFGEQQVSESVMDRWSPALTVNEKTPPTFLWTTHQDQVVPASQSLELAMALDQEGISYECHLFNQGPHGLSLATARTASRPEQVNEAVSQWFDLALNWLKEIDILQK